MIGRGAASLLLIAALAAGGPSARAGDDGADGDRPLRPAEVEPAEFVLPSPEEPWLGLTVASEEPSLRIGSVEAGGPAAAAGIRAGDVLLALDGVAPPDGRALGWMVGVRVAGEPVAVRLRRGGVERTVAVVLGRRPGEGALFRGREFRLAVVPLSLRDRPRGPQPDDGTLDRAFFSATLHRGRLPSGRRLHGSLRDYFRDQSLGALEVTGRVLPTVAVPASTDAFREGPMGAGPDSLYARATAILVDRGDVAALQEFDGVAFLYPGPVASPPGRALWPHRATVRVGGRVLPYFVKNVAEDGEPEPIGVPCHEFGHLLGLPDQYGVAHRTGVGDFCLMALGHRGGGDTGSDRPFGLCAWCRAVLGWLRPVPLDPGRVQHLVLAPSTAGPREAFLVPGSVASECFLLEVRRREGWDGDLPGEGLLVWRAGAPPAPGAPPDLPWLDLVEAHGMAAPDASLLRPDEVPFPGRRGAVLSAETHGAAAGRLRLSAVRTLPGGHVAFRFAEPGPFSAPPPRDEPLEVDAHGYATLRDPVTGEDVPVFVGPPPAADEPAPAPAHRRPPSSSGE